MGWKLHLKSNAGVKFSIRKVSINSNRFQLVGREVLEAKMKCLTRWIIQPSDVESSLNRPFNSSASSFNLKMSFVWPLKPTGNVLTEHLYEELTRNSNSSQQQDAKQKKKWADSSPLWLQQLWAIVSKWRLEHWKGAWKESTPIAQREAN